jgi:hypothetical protein
MAYTVTAAYNRILEEADKLGSDYFTLPQVLSAFKKETLSFVGARAKEVELNQEVTDDVRSLVESKLIPFVNNPDDSLQKMATLPNDYLRKISINVKYTDGLKARLPTIERHGEHNTNSISPYKKPDRSYPLIQQFSNYFNVHTGIPSDATIQPDKLILIYFKNPTFGSTAEQVVVNLPDDVCEYLFVETANALRLNTGEPSASNDFQINQLFRNK